MAFPGGYRARRRGEHESGLQASVWIRAGIGAGKQEKLRKPTISEGWGTRLAGAFSATSSTLKAGLVTGDSFSASGGRTIQLTRLNGLATCRFPPAIDPFSVMF
jgi:hypothetical protein